MLKQIKRGRVFKRTNSYDFVRRDLVAKATLSSSLSTEQKLYWLSSGVWIPFRPL